MALTKVSMELLEGVTSTAAELNLLDGVSATTAELNLLDGKTFIDSDTMSGASATTLSSSESIKAYVDSGGGAYSDWIVKDANYQALIKDQIICNKASTFIITLPAASAPSGVGNTVIISNIGAGAVTVARNSSLINSTASDATLLTNKSTQLVYVSDAIGWKEIP